MKCSGKALAFLLGLAPCLLLAEANFWYNSSFELGKSGWDSGHIQYIFPKDESQLPIRVLDNTTAAHGKSSLKLNTGTHYYPGWIFSSPEIALKPGKKYTVSFYAKARKAVSISGAIRNNHLGHWNNTSQWESFKIGPVWKRYSFSFTHAPKGIFSTSGYEYYHLHLVFPQEKNEFNLDAFQIEEGVLTDYKPAAEVEYAITMPSLYIRDKSTVEASISAISYRRSQTTEPSVVLTDNHTGRILQKKTASFALNAGNMQTRQLVFNDIPYGGFRINAESAPRQAAVDFVRIRTNNAVWQKGKFAVGIGSKGLGEFSYRSPDLGSLMAWERYFGEDDGELVRLSGAVINTDFSYRLDSLSILCPEGRRKYNWTFLDLYTEKAKKLNLKAAVGIGCRSLVTNKNGKDTGSVVPQWFRQLDRCGNINGMRSGQWSHIKVALPPPEIIGEIAGDIVEHCGKDTMMFRLFPEANGYMRPEHIYEYAKASYEAIRKVNPDIIVNSITPTEDGGVKMGGFFAEYLKLGGAAYTDMYGFHPYQSAQDDSPFSAMSNIEAFRKVMKEHHVLKPLGQMECFYLGSSTTGRKGERTDFETAAISRRILIDMGEGLNMSIPLELNHLHRSNPSNESAYDWFQKSPTPRFATHSAMGYFLNGATQPAKVQLPGNLLCYTFTNHDKRFSTIWSISGSKTDMTLPLPEGVSCTVYDIFGNTVRTVGGVLKLELNREPCLIEWSGNRDPAAIHRNGKYAPRQMVEVYGVRTAPNGVAVMLSNISGESLSGKLRIESEWLSGGSVRFYDLQPFAASTVIIPTAIKADAPAKFKVSLILTASGKMFRIENEQNNVPVQKLDGEIKYFQLKEHSFSLQRDGESLKIIAELHSENMTLPKTQDTLWSGDCVELFFDYAPEQYNPAQPSNYNSKCIQLILGATKDGIVIPDARQSGHPCRMFIKMHSSVRLIPGKGAQLTVEVPWMDGMGFNISFNGGGKNTVWRGEQNYKNRSAFTILTAK